MRELATIALLGWIPAVLLLFFFMRPLTAVLTAFLGAWLFLPMAEFTLRGLPDITKMSATSYGVMLGALLFDAKRVFAFRPGLIDLPMALWCLMPILTGMANGLPGDDNASLFLEQVVWWGLPWLIGRLYLTDASAFRDLAVALVIAGLVYVPLCAYELVMSPQLHRLFYGDHQHDFAQTPRWGGWRPMVFMQHPLMVAAWMMSTSLVAIWLWMSGSVRRVMGVPLSWLVPPLLATAILCKSMGAIVLMTMGLGTMIAVRYLRLNLVIAALALFPVAFIGARLTGVPVGDSLVAFAKLVEPDRAESLQFRLKNEEVLLDWARQRPVLGWGWGRNRPLDEYGMDRVVTDGMWIIFLGVYGVVGLVALYGFLLAPAALVGLKSRKMSGPTDPAAPVMGLCVIAILFVVDTIPNSMVNPVFFFLSGGLGTGCKVLWRQRIPRAQPLGLRAGVPSGPPRAAPGIEVDPR